MNRGFKYYLTIWAILTVAFNLVAFLLPAWPNKYTATYWIGYGFVMAASIGFLIVALNAFRVKTMKRLFLNLSQIHLCWVGTVACSIVGIVFMAFPILPEWLGGIICLIVLVLCVIPVVGAGTAAASAADLEEKVAHNTALFRALAAEAEALAAAADGENRTIAKKVYEAIRFSDYISSPQLAQVEEAISAKFALFSTQVEANDSNAQSTGMELLTLIKKRNTQCKSMK